jgi:hypothetical protein
LDRDSSSGLHTKLDDDLLNRLSFNWTTRIGRRASERDMWGMPGAAPETRSRIITMIHKEGPQFLKPPRHSAPHAALLNRRALLAGPAAVLCTEALHAVAAEPRSLVLSLANTAQVTPRNVSVTPALFNGRICVEVRPSGDYPAPDRDYFAYVPGLDMRDGTIEVELAGAPLPGAPGGARGFAGLAFRIDEAGGTLRVRGYISPPHQRPR